jgi:hypothetical protein
LGFCGEDEPANPVLAFGCPLDLNRRSRSVAIGSRAMGLLFDANDPTNRAAKAGEQIVNTCAHRSCLQRKREWANWLTTSKPSGGKREPNTTEVAVIVLT